MTTASTISTTTSNTNSALKDAAQSILSGTTNSKLDANTLVSALVTGKTAGQAATISNTQATDNTELSAVGSAKAALSALQTALEQTSLPSSNNSSPPTSTKKGSLSDGSIFSLLGAKFSGTGITASTTSDAAAGSYSVSVQQLAKANQISSQAFASGAKLGAGTVTIGVGSKSTTVTLDPKNDTLPALAAAINSGSGNPGVTASVVTAADGQHLVLTSTQTGAANAVTVSAGVGIDPGLQTANFTQVAAAQDAKLTISGNAVTSPSNTVTSALNGVTLILKPDAVGTTQTLTIATDDSAITDAVTNFVKQYNAWVSTATALSSYDASSKTAGPLLGDAMLNSAVNGIASIMSAGVTVDGTTYSLAQIGLDLQNDGTLKLDTSALQTALAASPASVAGIFNGKNGIGHQLDSFINSYTQTNVGQIDQRTAALNTDLQRLAEQKTALTDYQQSLATQYNTQFSALNNTLSHVQSNTAYLNQLFGGDGNPGTLNKK
ncbi:MAG TPA: flagellar filament capping protein FliD [Trinickia sp.]|jgi:flagellar hook-associated protein 2|nr:flagellar filament capping protein FliD [Trinickia sp.]